MVDLNPKLFEKDVEPSFALGATDGLGRIL